MEADTTPNEEYTDRISVVLRYINDARKPSERLFDIRETVDKTGLGQAQDILPIIEEHRLNTDEFQLYVFAAAISGKFLMMLKRIHLRFLVGMSLQQITNADKTNTQMKTQALV